MIGGKSVPEWSFVRPKKQVFGWNFLIKPSPYLFSGPNWLYGALGGKIVPDENVSQFCLNSPLEFVFPKNTYSVEFLYKIAPHQFYGSNGLDGAIRGKSFPERSFVLPKKHVLSSDFLTKPAPLLVSGPNCLYGAFVGKVVPDENFAQFCLKSPLKFVFPKNTFSVWTFLLNRTSPIFPAKRTR